MSGMTTAGSARQPEAIRVLIADDELLFTDALSHVLGERGIGLEAVKTCDEVRERLDSANGRYDLVVLYVGTPQVKALACLSAIKSRHADAKVAVMAPTSDPELLADVIRRGAIGVLTKESSLKSLATAMRFMAEGERFVPAGFLQAVPRRPSSEASELSPQEKRILSELAVGRSNQQIALELDLPVGVVKAQIKTLYRKLGVHNRTKAALVARTSGFI